MSRIVSLLSVVAAVACLVPAASAGCNKDDYYSGISYLQPGNQPTDEAEWRDLISQLYSLLRNTHVIIPYTSSSTDVWDALGVLDADPTNASNVILTYSGISMAWSLNGKSAGWNREHVWPRSYGLFDNGPDYSDLHNLRPADWGVNSARSNLYYDDCYPSVDPACTQPAHAEAASDTAKNSYKFMPSEGEKGDLARVAFYDALRYNGPPEDKTENLTLSDCACVSKQNFGNLTTLLRWHQMDAVTVAEQDRNNKTCHLYQKNRNPFVDFPWLSAMFTVPYVLESVRSLCPSDYVDPDSTSCMTVEPLEPTLSPTISAAPTPIPIACDLTAGDVALVSVNTDDPDSISVVALRSIPIGEELYFTDRPWNGNEFPSSGEGVLSFLTTAVIPAGSTWYYPGGGGSFGAWTEALSSFRLSTSGDQIIAYCGSITSPIFLYALSNNGWLGDGSSTTSTTSVLPADLASANASVSLLGIDNQYYDGPFSGTRSDLLSFIANANNWKGSNTIAAPLDISEFLLWADPTTSPTLIPTKKPSFAPSTAGPSRLPTRTPTTLPGAFTRMYFTTSLRVDDVMSEAAEDWSSDVTLRLTLQDAIPEVSVDDIDVLSMVAATRLSYPLEEVMSYTVQYAIDVVLEDMGYSASDGAALYEAWVDSIDQSVSSGEFSDNLAEHAEEEGADPLTAATVSSSQEVYYSDYKLTTSSAAMKGSTHNVTLGTKIGHLAFILGMSAAAAFIIYSFISGQKKHDSRLRAGIANATRNKKTSSDDPFQVTVRRTTFSTKRETYDGDGAVSNPLCPFSAVHTTSNDDL